MHDLQSARIRFLFPFKSSPRFQPRNDAGIINGQNLFRHKVSHFGITIAERLNRGINQAQVVEGAAFAGGFDDLEPAAAEARERRNQRLQRAGPSSGCCAAFGGENFHFSEQRIGADLALRVENRVQQRAQREQASGGFRFGAVGQFSDALCHLCKYGNFPARLFERRDEFF